MQMDMQMTPCSIQGLISPHPLRLKSSQHGPGMEKILLIQYHSYRTCFIYAKTLCSENNLYACPPQIRHLVTLPSSESVRELLQRTSDELGLLPQVGGQVTVCVADSDEGSLQGVLECLGRTGGGGVDVVDTGKLEEALDGGGGNETGTTGSGDKLFLSV